MGICNDDYKGQSIISDILIDQDNKIKAIENILNNQALQPEFQSLCLNTQYIIHRMLYKLKNISAKECIEKSPIYFWSDYEILNAIQDEKYMEDVWRNKILIVEYFKVLKKPVPKLVANFNAKVFVPEVVSILGWTSFNIINEDWSKYFTSKIHRDLTMIFALLYYYGADITANEAPCIVKHRGMNKNTVTFENCTFVVPDILAEVFELYPNLDTVLVRNLWKNCGINSYQFRWSGIYRRCLKYDKQNDNLIYLSISSTQVDTKILISFGFPQPRNDYDKDKMINRYKQWRTYFKL